MAANDRPRVDGLDEAVWRRLRLIPFTVTIAPEHRNPNLIAELLRERDAILTWAVDGCLAWQRDKLTPPAAILAATNEYREESNPLRDWFDAECEADPDALTPAKALRDSYESWCRSTCAPQVPARSPIWPAGLAALGCRQAGSD